MVYYYICDSCGQVKELNFNPDQEIVWCDNPEHPSRQAMRIVVPEDGVSYTDTPHSVDVADKENLKGCVNTFIFGMIALFLTAVSGILVLLVIWLWIEIWQMIF